jgi:hypothetical protein
MDPARLRKVEELYEAALEVEPARRDVFLSENCAGDESLRCEVESLLLHDENAGHFLETPALEMLPDRPRPMVGQHVSHYEILEKLGEGGMGAVYRVYDTELRRQVALKVLRAELHTGPDGRRRLVREARAASALNHPNIVTVHEIGSERGVDFIAMEWGDFRWERPCSMPFRWLMPWAPRIRLASFTAI